MGWLPELKWEKDAAGYRIEERDDETGASSFWLAGNGGKRAPVHIMGLAPFAEPAFIKLANVQRLSRDVEENVLAFTNAFGLPAREAQTNEIELAELDAVITELRTGVSMLHRGDLAGASVLGDLITRLEFRLDKGTHNLVLNIGTLTGFVFMQLFYAAQKAVKVMRCPICYGYTVVKSSKRQWCSDACKKRAGRQKMGHLLATEAPNQ